MTRWLMLVLALGVAAVQQEQYPGQSRHAEPPAGYSCTRQRPDFSIPWDRVCTCNHMATKSPDGSCAHDPDGTEHVIEDPQCSSFCWRKGHCDCPVVACDT